MKKNYKDILFFVAIFVITLSLVLILFPKKDKIKEPELVKVYTEREDIMNDLGWVISTPIEIDDEEITEYQYYKDDRLVAVFGDKGKVSKSKNEITLDKEYKYSTEIGLGKQKCTVSGDKLKFYAAKWKAGKFYYAIELKDYVDLYKMNDYVVATD